MKQPPPLSGIRVIELGQAVSLPYCTQMLVELGAEVTKVENPWIGDSARHNGDALRGESPPWLTYNRNKKSVALNLAEPDDRRRFDLLVSHADVLVTNTLPSNLEKFGVTFERLLDVNPRLVVCRIAGFDASTPRGSAPSYDPVLQAVSGYYLLHGREGDPPLGAGIPLADLGVALYAALGVVSALHQVSTTGEGVEIRVAMHDCMLALLGMIATIYLNTGQLPVRAGNWHEFIAPWQPYRASDGYVVVAIVGDTKAGMWQAFCDVLGLPEMASDPRFATNADRVRNRLELEEMVEERLMTRETSYWISELARLRIPAAPVQTIGEALDDVSLQSPGLISSYSHPKVGEVRYVGLPIRFQDALTVEPRRPPNLGEHNEEISDE